MKKVNLGLFNSSEGLKANTIQMAHQKQSSHNSQSISQSQQKQIKDTSSIQGYDLSSLKQSKGNSPPKEQTKIKQQPVNKNLKQLFVKDQTHDINDKVQIIKQNQVENQPKLNLLTGLQLKEQDSNKQIKNEDSRKLNPFLQSNQLNPAVLFQSKPQESPSFGYKLIQSNNEKDQIQKSNPFKNTSSNNKGFDQSESSSIGKPKAGLLDKIAGGLFGQANTNSNSMFSSLTGSLGQSRTNLFGQNHATASIFGQNQQNPSNKPANSVFFGQSKPLDQIQLKNQRENLFLGPISQKNNIFNKKSDQSMKKLLPKSLAQPQNFVKQIKQQPFKRQVIAQNKMIDEGQEISAQQNAKKVNQKRQKSKIQTRLRKQKIQAELQQSKQRLLSLLRKGNPKVTIINPITQILPHKLTSLKQHHKNLQQQNELLSKKLFKLYQQKQTLLQQLKTFQSKSSLTTLIYPKLSIHLQSFPIPRVTQLIDQKVLEQEIKELVNQVKETWRDQEGEELFNVYYEAKRKVQQIRRERNDFIVETERLLQQFQHQQINTTLNVAPKLTKLISSKPSSQIKSHIQSIKGPSDNLVSIKQKQLKELPNQYNKDHTDKQIHKKQAQLNELRQQSAQLRANYDELRRKVQPSGSKLSKISSISGKSALFRSEIYA